MLTAELQPITGYPPLPLIPQESPPPTLKQTALASFVAIEGHMHTLAERYRDVVFEVGTPKGMKEAKAARLVLREEGRFPVQRLVQRLKDEANDLKKALDDRGAEVIALTKPVEDAIHRQIEVEEQRVAAEKAEKVRIEAERVEALQAKLNGLSVWIERCREPGMTAERIGNGISMFAAVPMHPEEWQEFHARALARHDEVLDVMIELHRQAIEREAEAARLEAQRIENERIAAAQRAESERLAAERAELDRRRAEVEASERQRQEAALAELRRQDAAEAASIAAHVVVEATPITRDAEENGSSPADAPAAVDAPRTCASSEAESATASPSGDEGPAAHADDSAADPDDHEGGIDIGPPTLRLGAIGERLRFPLTENFLTDIGFPPAGRDKAARLYHQHQWPAIKAALIKHIEGLD